MIANEMFAKQQAINNNIINVKCAYITKYNFLSDIRMIELIRI